MPIILFISAKSASLSSLLPTGLARNSLLSSVFILKTKSSTPRSPSLYPIVLNSCDLRLLSLIICLAPGSYFFVGSLSTAPSHPSETYLSCNFHINFSSFGIFSCGSICIIISSSLKLRFGSNPKFKSSLNFWITLYLSSKVLPVSTIS